MISGSRWVMVTGASSGLGHASAMMLAERGWNVGVHYRSSREKAEQLANQITELGRSSFIAQGDMGDAGICGELVSTAWKESGRIDAWVHFAGADILTGPTAKLSFEEKLDLLWNVDVRGTIVTCRAVGEQMRQQGGGTIITVGWDQVASGMDGESGELFGATKGGVEAFTRSLAKSLAPTVRVNCLAPGFIKTAWGETASEAWQERVRRETPMDRWGTPEEIAGAVAFLVSDDARFITGQTLAVNGGVVMR